MDSGSYTTCMQSKRTTARKRVTVVSARSADTIVRGPQGQRFVIGVNHDIGGSEHLAGGLVAMTPGMMAKTHVHHRSESVIVVIEGWAATLIGPELTPTFQGPGDFLFIPEGVAHTGLNLSDTERCIAIELRTEKVFNEDVAPLPELMARAETVAAELRRKFAAGELPLPADWQAVRGAPFTFTDPEAPAPEASDPAADAAAAAA